MHEWLSLSSTPDCRAKVYVKDTEESYLLSCSKNGEIDMWIEQDGQNSETRMAREEKPVEGENPVCGRTKNNFLFSAGLKHLHFQYLELS